MGFGFWGSEVFVYGWFVEEKVLTKESPSCGGFRDEPDLGYIFVHEDNCGKEESIGARSGDEGHIVIEFDGYHVQVFKGPVSPLDDRMSGRGTGLLKCIAEERHWQQTWVWSSMTHRMSSAQTQQTFCRLCADFL